MLETSTSFIVVLTTVINDDIIISDVSIFVSIISKNSLLEQLLE